jgi:hypothetical protein
MVGALQKFITKTILPFTVSSQANGVFNGDIEKAAVFCTAELNRQKGGGFFRKQDAEKLVFTSKVLYPFWITPFRESTLLLDGLNVASYTITYPALPDLKAFIERLKEQQMIRQVHTNFLSNNQNYFQNSNNEQKLVIDGLLNDAEFNRDFLKYVKQATTTDLPITEAVLVTPALNEEGVLKMLQNIESTRLKLSEDLADLKETIKLLNSKSLESQADLREEIKAVENEFGVKIRKAKAILDDKVSEINKAYADEVAVVSNRFERKITGLQTDLVKCEKEKGQLDEEIEHVESEIKTSAINKDDSAEQKWKEKRNELKDQRPEIASKLKETQKLIDEEEEAKKTSLFQLMQDNEAKIREVSKDLLEIESAQDAEIKVFRNEIEKIEDLTSNIIEKVNELSKNREEKMLEFDQLGIRQKRTDHLLVYMPFYLSCYHSKSAKRYTYLAPSDVSDGGLSARLKALGKIKISQLFQPKYKRISSILNSFIGLMDENIVFSRETSEACLKANILQIEKSAQDSVRSGLNKLKEQGWLSESEFEEFNQVFTLYFSG